MNTNSDTAGPFYVADTGSVILKLKWISSSRVLAVFDTYAAIINVSDGTESARYDYGGATLQSVSISGRSTALLLAVGAAVGCGVVAGSTSCGALGICTQAHSSATVSRNGKMRRRIDIKSP